METRARDLDREVYQDPDSDRYLIPSERVFDNAADDLETIAVSKRSISLLPQKEVVRTDLQPFKQETHPLANIWCVKMEEDTHQPNELNSQMRAMKTYLKARYRLVDLLKAQRNNRITSNLKRWIENGAPDKGDLEEDSYRILRQYFMQKEGRLCLNKDGIVVCKKRGEDKVLYKYNAIVLPQLYQTELLFRSHDQVGHQGIDKVYQRILKRFEWLGMKKACEKWVTACLSCQQVKDVDRESMKYRKTERDDPSWAAQEGQLLIPASNLDLISGMQSTGTSMDIFVRGVGVGLTHTENLMIKKLRIVRGTGDLKTETGEETKKPDIGRVV